AIGKKIVTVDMFDKPATCQKVWNRLLSGFVLDTLESKSDDTQASAAEVQEMLGTASGMSWVKAEPVGEGEEYRADSGADVHASALTFHESPVHLSLVTAG
ncbi:MAG: ARPP-1 family domain-containing protein, partial [Thermoguttaceae bacterium]